MASRPWQTNASARLDEFIGRKSLNEADAQLIVDFVLRLIIDPFDVPANKDRVGEWHCRIGQSSTFPGSTLAVTFQIDRDYRYVSVIPFELLPARGG